MSGYIGVLPVPQTTQTRESFTATAGQTSFGTSGYQIDHLDVYLNGVKLAAADYTATNGSDIVLTSGAAVNDILEMVAFETFTIANQSFTGTTTVDTLVVTNTVDGRDVSVDGAKLDTIPIISTSSTPSFTAKSDGTTDGYIQLNCSQNSHGIKLKSPPHSANASYTLTFPNDDGNAGQFLKTDGSGGLSWATDSTTDSTKLPLAGGAMTGAITTNSTFDGVDVGARDVVLTDTTTKATAALPKTGGAMTGAITTNSTFDGVDIATRDAVLTNTTTTANAALPKAGGALTGAVTTNSTFDGVDISTRDAVLTSTTTTANAALPKAGGTITGLLTSGTDVGLNSEYLVLGDDTSNRQLKLTQYQTGGSNNNAGHKINASSGFGELALAVGGTNRLVANTTGVAITGTTTSSGQVKVTGSSSSAVAFSVGDAGTGFYNTGSNSIGLSINGTNKLQVNNSGNVGIGTTNPVQKLSVKVGSDIIVGVWGDNSAGYGAIQSANVANNAYKQLRFDASSYHFAQGNMGLGISTINNTYSSSHNLQIASVSDNNWGGTLSLTSANGSSVFSRLVASTSGFDVINQKNTPLRFFTNNTECMRILASGKIKLRPAGYVDDTQTLGVINISSAGSGETRAIDIDGSWTSGERKSINWIHGSSATNYIGSIECRYNGPSSFLSFGKLYYAADSSAYTMTLESTSTTGADLSLLKGNLKVASGYGINFSAYGAGTNVNNNLLNDYEEGEWTPVIGGSTTTSGQSYNSQYGTYTKVGNIVTVHAYISFGNVGTVSGTYAYIMGLPFNISSGSGAYPSVNIGYFHGLQQNVSSLMGYGNQGSDFAYITYRNGAGTLNQYLSPAGIGTSSWIFSITYNTLE